MGQKEDIKFLTILPNSDNEQLALDVLNCTKKNKGIEKNEICSSFSVNNDPKKRFVDKCINMGLLEVEKDGENELIQISSEKYNFLGIGFASGKCYLNVLNMRNEVVSSCALDLGFYFKQKIKEEDISSILEGLKNANIDRNNISSVCVAVPEYLLSENKNLNRLVDGIKEEFNSVVRVVANSTACAYGDREHMKLDSDTLYMYSDIGTGVVLKKELIFEASEPEVKVGGEYLRPWNQYSVVDSAKEFVSKGVGTEIVHMVGGDLDKITTEVVLAAASKGDELSTDLVRRSGLALGVRVAYLLDIFNVKTIVFGGDIKEGDRVFIDTVKESMEKFLDPDLMKQVKLIPGILGREAASIGAAALSRRQLFMEV